MEESSNSSSSRETTNSALNLIQILIEEIIMTRLTSTEASVSNNNSNSNPAPVPGNNDVTEENHTDLEGIVYESCERTLRLISETERERRISATSTSRFIPSDDEDDDEYSLLPALVSDHDFAASPTPIRPRISWNQLYLNLHPNQRQQQRQQRQRDRTQDFYPQPMSISHPYFSAMDQRSKPPPISLGMNPFLPSAFPEKPPLIQMGTKSFQPIAKFDPTLEAKPAKPRTNGFSLCQEKAMAAKIVQKNLVRHRFNGFGGDIDVFNRFWQETDTVERTNDRPTPSLSSLFNDLDDEWNVHAENTRNPIQTSSGSGEIDLLDIENEYLGQRMNREMEMMSSMFRLENPNASNFVRTPVTFMGTRNGGIQRDAGTSNDNHQGRNSDDDDDSEYERNFDLGTQVDGTVRLTTAPTAAGADQNQNEQDQE